MRPSFHTVETAAALVELRLAATAQYPAARWVSRRALAHAQALEPPLPDALLETDTTAVAVIVKLRPLDRRELEGRVAPILDRHDHTLLVLPSLSEQAREWIDERMGRTTAIAYRRDARVVAAQGNS